MNHLLKLFSFSCLLISLSTHAQRVGVVLSGGGAKAAAHIGVLRALEENNVPIDFITGTSMGAMIGALYASGYSIAEIDSLIRSDEYVRMAQGNIDEEMRYFFKEYEQDAGMGTIKFASGKFINSSLPTSLINTGLLDFNLMRDLSSADAAANYNFDSLYVPFRCLAADVEEKREVVFRNGHLATAVRASMTYPFYLSPIRVDGRLLFDGGLYNNFPSNVMYHEFMPDIIIGSNVSNNEEPPEEDDILSQFKSMVMYETNFDAICEQMIIIEPDLEIGTFDFADVGEAIRAGYMQALVQMDTILSATNRRISEEERIESRKQFRSRFKPMVFNNVTITGVEKTEKIYVKQFFERKSETISINKMRRTYFRMLADDQIKSAFPAATYNRQDQKYTLNLNIRKEKNIGLTAGGNFSSRPINVGYIGVRYNFFGRVGSSIHANSYFGKFYGSAHADMRFDFPFSIPISIEPGFTFNRWDYFRSFATFFEEVKPSFIVINERYGGLKIKIPVNNKGRLEMHSNYARIEDEYYQIENFLATDTADRTRLDAGIFDLAYIRNTLNRKLYANSGTFLKLRAKLVTGEEKTLPGSTSLVNDTTYIYHNWLNAKVSYVNYFSKFGPFTAGFMLEGVLSDQPFFDNYIASVISAPVFQPIPESQTFFLPQHRAHSYAAGGFMLITSFSESLDLRIEGYVFNALRQIQQDELLQPEYKATWKPYYIGSTNLVFESPIGPISLAANYYQGKEKPWSLVFNFGYLIFNRSVRND
jgi:NTE family protein